MAKMSCNSVLRALSWRDVSESTISCERKYWVFRSSSNFSKLSIGAVWFRDKRKTRLARTSSWKIHTLVQMSSRKSPRIAFQTFGPRNSGTNRSHIQRSQSTIAAKSSFSLMKCAYFSSPSSRRLGILFIQSNANSLSSSISPSHARTSRAY